MLVHRFDNDVFDVGCGNARDRSARYRLRLSLEMRQRDVIAIANSTFGGVGWDHAVARIVVQQAGWEMVGFGFGVISVGPLIGEPLLNRIKKLPIHDRGLLAGQVFTLVFDLANIAGSLAPSFPCGSLWKIYRAVTAQIHPPNKRDEPASSHLTPRRTRLVQY